MDLIFFSKSFWQLNILEHVASIHVFHLPKGEAGNHSMIKHCRGTQIMRNHEISAVRDRNIIETELPSQAENANLMREKYEILRMQQIHLTWSHRAEVAIRGCKWQSGGARRMAVTSHLLSETECRQGRLLAETPTYPILILSSWRVTKKKPWSGLK